eukprot:Skav228586  [mRNA]  locus=scaffold1470:194272:194604:+ [translate_table: standard]
MTCRCLISWNRWSVAFLAAMAAAFAAASALVRRHNGPAINEVIHDADMNSPPRGPHRGNNNNGDGGGGDDEDEDEEYEDEDDSHAHKPGRSSNNDNNVRREQQTIKHAEG